MMASSLIYVAAALLSCSGTLAILGDAAPAPAPKVSAPAPAPLANLPEHHNDKLTVETNILQGIVDAPGELQ